MFNNQFLNIKKLIIKCGDNTENNIQIQMVLTNNKMENDPANYIINYKKDDAKYNDFINYIIDDDKYKDIIHEKIDYEINDINYTSDKINTLNKLYYSKVADYLHVEFDVNKIKDIISNSDEVHVATKSATIRDHFTYGKEMREFLRKKREKKMRKQA